MTSPLNRRVYEQVYANRVRAAESEIEIIHTILARLTPDQPAIALGDARQLLTTAGHLIQHLSELKGLSDARSVLDDEDQPSQETQP